MNKARINIMTTTTNKYDVEVLENVDLTGVAEQKALDATGRGSIDNSFFVCDLGAVIDKYKLWNKVFPNIRPHYAVKAAPHRPLIETLYALGSGFDCASKEEIELAKELGVDGNDIIFAHTMKQVSHLRCAREAGVKKIVFDSEDELVKIQKYYPEAQLVLRTVIDDLKTVKNLRVKFGARESVGRDLLLSAKKKGLEVIGVSFYITLAKVEFFTPTAYRKFIEVSRKLFDYGNEVGFDMHLLDIGGGFPGHCACPEEAMLKIADLVNTALNDFFPKDLFPHLKVISEPGRFFSTSPFVLATNVIGKKIDERPESGNNSGGKKFMYFVNDGSHGALKCLFIRANFKRFLTKRNQDLRHLSCIWGPTCDETDVVMDDVLLPELDNEDWIFWEDCGAYSFSMANWFNGFKTKVIYYVISNNHMELLKATSMKDLGRFNFIKMSE